MRAHKNALLCFGLAATLSVAAVGNAMAQNRATPGAAPSGGGYGGGGGGGIGWGAAAGALMVLPHLLPRPSQGREIYVDDDDFIDMPRRRQRQAEPQRQPQNSARRAPSNAPPANERRLVPDEVVIELRNSVTPAQVTALQNRYRLTRLESQVMQLSGTTMYRWRIPDRRTVPVVVRTLEGDALVASAQPNYQYTLQQTAAGNGDPAQYELAKLRLPEAHFLARGGDIKVAVIDSGVDAAHPELEGSLADSFNAIGSPMAGHAHGTSIAGLIVAHGKLLGAAPNAKILAVRAFDPVANTAQGTTFAILKGLDWSAAQRARIINMSFAGPSDPAVHRALDAAFKKGIVLIAAAGNAGPKSAPLFPAADPNVIAVSATDAEDKLLEASNRGTHISVAAPGAQLLVATPDGYEFSSGTSYSAATVSGIVALMLEKRGDMTPAQVRGTLQATAKDLGPKGKDAMFGAGLTDAMGALNAPEAALASAGRPSGKPAVERVSTGVR